MVKALLIFLIIVGVKLPLIAVGWVIYRAINDVPEPEIETDGGDFARAAFDQGPRRRGPHGNAPADAIALRRGDKGHDEAAEPARPRAARDA